RALLYPALSEPAPDHQGGRGRGRCHRLGPFCGHHTNRQLLIMEEIKIFSPATIANVSCGFDVLGLALESVGDEMLLRKSPQKGFRILGIQGQDLPLEPERNVAGVAGMALMEKLG